MPRIIGLDFGTTNTRIHLGYVDRAGQVAVVDLPESDRGSLPTVIIVSEAGALQGVGRQAEKALQNPSLRDSVRFEFKPCLGRGQYDLEAQTAGLTMELKCPECDAKIPDGFRFCGQCGKPLPDDFKQTVAERALRYEREDAFGYAELLLERVGGWLRERTLGGGWEGGDTVVVGVPVHWSDQTRQEYADLVGRAFATEHIQVVDEPHAALAEYLSRAGAEVRAGERVLVVDVGGGTTDLVAGTVRKDGTLDEVRRHGIRYGGADFDDAIVAWAMKELGPKEGLSEDQLAGALRPYCRELKEELSDAVKSGLDGENPSRSTMVAIPPTLMASLELDRATFESEDLAGPLLGYLGTALSEGLRQMGSREEDMGHVLLIGGGSNAYFVEDLARRVFPRAKVVVGQQPEMAISRGLVVAVTSALSVAAAEEVVPPAELPCAIPESERTEQAPSPDGVIAPVVAPEAGGAYVDAERSRGRSDAEIRAALERSGWEPAAVDVLLGRGEDGEAVPPSPAPTAADTIIPVAPAQAETVPLSVPEASGGQAPHQNAEAIEGTWLGWYRLLLSRCELNLVLFVRRDTIRQDGKLCLEGRVCWELAKPHRATPIFDGSYDPLSGAFAFRAGTDGFSGTVSNDLIEGVYGSIGVKLRMELRRADRALG